MLTLHLLPARNTNEDWLLNALIYSTATNVYEPLCDYTPCVVTLYSLASHHYAPCVDSIIYLVQGSLYLMCKHRRSSLRWERT